MKSNLKTFVSSLLIFCVPVLVATFSAAQEVKAQGIINSRTGETLTITTPEGNTTTITLTNDTKVEESKLFSADDATAAVLIPGLKVSVEGTSDDQGRLVAEKINFNSGDLETAQMIQAGLHPTAEQVAANKQQTEQNKEQIERNMKDTEANTDRLSDLSEYDVKSDATVDFPVDSSDISVQDKQALMKLAQDAANLKGYIIEVKGYADSSGPAAMNQKLSADRAQAVVAFLVQDCKVPMRHVVAPAAMGETQAVASNDTAAGRAENRRVEVKVLVNRGVAGK